MATDKHFEEYAALATLPLRDVVVYPHMVLPLFVGREKSIAALDLAMANDEPVFLLAQRDPNEEEPRAEDLHEMGTVAQVLQVLKLPDGTVKVLVEGIRRGRALRVKTTANCLFRMWNSPTTPTPTTPIWKPCAAPCCRSSTSSPS